MFLGVLAVEQWRHAGRVTLKPVRVCGRGLAFGTLAGRIDVSVVSPAIAALYFHDRHTLSLAHGRLPRAYSVTARTSAAMIGAGHSNSGSLGIAQHRHWKSPPGFAVRPVRGSTTGGFAYACRVPFRASWAGRTCVSFDVLQ